MEINLNEFKNIEELDNSEFFNFDTPEYTEGIYYVSLRKDGHIDSYDCYKTTIQTIKVTNLDDILYKTDYSLSDYIVVDEKAVLQPYQESIDRVNKKHKEQDFIENGSECQEEQDDAICELFEENLALQKINEDEDDAICSLYEENIELKERADDTDDAICDLYELITV